MRRPAANGKPKKKTLKARPKTRKATRKADGLEAEEVSFLLDKLQAEERCETAWKAMTSTEGEDGEPYGEVEKRLTNGGSPRGRAAKRWKYFAR